MYVKTSYNDDLLPKHVNFLTSEFKSSSSVTQFTGRPIARMDFISYICLDTKRFNMAFKRTTAVNKLLRMRKRIRIVPGGTSAGKTYGIIPVLIDYAIKNPGTEVSIVSESIPHLRKGALKDFLKIMKDTGRYFDRNYNRTLLMYTFKNDSYIEFFSADQEDKVRGPRRNVLYINECNNLTFETYHQLAIRTDNHIWLDFNPSHEFWVHTEFVNDDDAEWLYLTYKDNESLTKALVKEIEKSRDKAYINPNLKGEVDGDPLFKPSNIKNYYWHNWWQVYGLGMLGSLEGVIFSNWKPIDAIPKDAKLIGYTIDFGYTNDPTAIIGTYKWNNLYIFHEFVYQKGLKNSEIAALMKEIGVNKNDNVVADSAEPKSIAEINSYGFRVIPADKGRDSISFGIDILQGLDIFYVTKQSINLIKELRSYVWARDKSGVTLNKPIDAFNHAIDAIRYFAMRFIALKSKRKSPKRRN